ncbi:MAG: hypothetical protein RLY31_1681 [Bacteroidota bacterium]
MPALLPYVCTYPPLRIRVHEGVRMNPDGYPPFARHSVDEKVVVPGDQMSSFDFGPPFQQLLSVCHVPSDTHVWHSRQGERKVLHRCIPRFVADEKVQHPYRPSRIPAGVGIGCDAEDDIGLLIEPGHHPGDPTVTDRAAVRVRYQNVRVTGAGYPCRQRNLFSLTTILTRNHDQVRMPALQI